MPNAQSFALFEQRAKYLRAASDSTKVSLQNTQVFWALLTLWISVENRRNA